MNTATLNFCGDTLEVVWTGSVWQAPCNGTQHSTASAAMREELTRHIISCGDDPEDYDLGEILINMIL